MQQEIQDVLAQLSAVYPTGPYHRDAARNISPYPEWRTVVHPNLETLKQQVNDHLEGVGFHVATHDPGIAGSGGAVPIIPWVTTRIHGVDPPNTAATQGVYVNYLFGMDGLEVFLVIGLATTPFNQAHFPPATNPPLIQLKKAYRKSLEDVSSVEIETVKNLFRQNTLSMGEFSFSAADNRAQAKDWQYSCPYWIRYDSTNLPTDDELKEDIENMLKLYNAIAEQRMIAPLDVLIEDIRTVGNPIGDDIELGGELYTKEKLRNMLRNFSIIPYQFKYTDWNLEYSTADWERLANHSNYLRISQRPRYLSSLGITKSTKQTITKILKGSFDAKTVILEGPSGVGKTYFYNKLVKSNYFDECELITFNPATENSDFIGGLRRS